MPDGSDPTPYDLAYAASVHDPEGFWAAAASALHWDSPWERVLDDRAAPLYRWFTGGTLNTCYNAIDRHVLGGRAEQAAVIYDSPVTGVKRTITYRELRDEVAQFAGLLRSLGVERGDRVILYMPMTPECLIGMYACARIGAVHSVVFGGFAANELAVRIDDAQPKVVLTASCGIEVQRTGTTAPATRHRWRACRCRPPTHSTSSTPPARPASRRVSCVTMADMRPRCSGPCNMCTT